MFDLDFFKGIIVLFLILVFVFIVIWIYNPKKKSYFEKYSKLPFDNFGGKSE